MNKTGTKVTIILWSTVALVAVMCLIGGIFGTKDNRNNNDGGMWFTMSGKEYDGKAVERRSEVISKNVTDIEIEWGRGKVEIFESDTDEIKIIQRAPDDMPESKLMKVSTSRNELSIVDGEINRYKGIFNFGGITTSKTYLEVYLPKKHFKSISIDGISCNIDSENLDVEDLEIDTISGDVNISGTFDEINMNSVSGRIKGKDITAKIIELDTVSGNIDVEGAFSEVDVSLVSGSSKIVSSTMLDRFESDGVSGSSTLSIPENDGFTVNFSKLSGSFKSDFDTTRDGDEYTYKNGNANFRIETLSGSVTIKKN